MRMLFVILFVILIMIIFSKKTTEKFSIFSSPGKWIGSQLGDVVGVTSSKIWRGVSGPMSFARDVLYNFTPNYTMVDRYLVNKSDWVRANKGLPPLKPATPSVSFRFADNKKEKKYTAGLGESYGKSLLNTVV